MTCLWPFYRSFKQQKQKLSLQQNYKTFQIKNTISKEIFSSTLIYKIVFFIDNELKTLAYQTF